MIDPALLTCAERIQYHSFVLRQENSRPVKALAASGMSIKKITRQTGRSRKPVRSVLAVAMATYSGAEAIFWSRTSSGSGPNGTADAAMAPNCGADFALPVSVGAFALWRSGRPGVGAMRGPG